MQNQLLTDIYTQTTTHPRLDRALSPMQIEDTTGRGSKTRERRPRREVEEQDKRVGRAGKNVSHAMSEGKH